MNIYVMSVMQHLLKSTVPSYVSDIIWSIFYL